MTSGDEATGLLVKESDEDTAAVCGEDRRREWVHRVPVLLLLTHLGPPAILSDRGTRNKHQSTGNRDGHRRAFRWYPGIAAGDLEYRLQSITCRRSLRHRFRGAVFRPASGEVTGLPAGKIPRACS